VSAADWGYLAGWRLVRLLPAGLARTVFRRGADWAVRRRGPGVQRLERNLRQVVGPEVGDAELALLVRDGLRSYARYWLEAFRLPGYSAARLDATFDLERGHLLGDAYRSGTGCVAALSHSANWDLGGAWVCAQGWPLTTVAERLRPESLYQRFLAYRRGLGMHIVPATGGERPPFDLLVEALGAGHVVALLADRDLSARGVDVTFFGGRTRMPAGPAMLALRTGAPLYVVPLWYDGPVLRGRVEGPIPMPDPASGPLDERVRIVTQSIADHFAAAIAAHPADWHMLARMWLADAPDDGAPLTGSASSISSAGSPGVTPVAGSASVAGVTPVAGSASVAGVTPVAGSASVAGGGPQEDDSDPVGVSR
jgi:KDO2-lipid IV(A) lauroyltransferase